jgi:hypothetical protein
MGGLREIGRQVGNERGLLTLDFIFATAIAFSFTAIFFAVTYTLSMIEVCQYITYATSRAYLGAQELPIDQSTLATAKFNDLLGSRPFKGLFANQWIVLGQPQLGDFTSEYPETAPDNEIFVGARVPFEAKVLHMHLPIGDTTTQDTTGKATLNSYLMREVTNNECRENFNRARYDHIKALYPQIPQQSKAALITDNGC